MTPAEAAIRAEIARRGPIPFADFMALALGHPEDGYYMAPASRPTRGGDFLTAPELHPIFGAALARQVAEAWERLERPRPLTLLEYGAGAGTLGLAILAGLREDGSPLASALAYAPVEINPHRVAELRSAAVDAGLPLVEAADLDPSPAAGVVVANEYVDALPVHVVEIGGGRPREIHVGIGCDGAFEEVAGEPTGAAVAEAVRRLAEGGVEIAEGQRVEVRPAVDAWAAEVGRRLRAGLVLVIDYGAPATELFGSRRRAGSVMTYRGHVADGTPDAPYRDVGERDITAHVDTTALAAALGAAGLALLGETTQAELLVGCGLQDLLLRRQGRAADAAEALELRSAVMRLLDPRHLGGFRAILAGRGIAAEPPLRGLAYRMPARR